MSRQFGKATVYHNAHPASMAHAKTRVVDNNDKGLFESLRAKDASYGVCSKFERECNRMCGISFRGIAYSGMSLAHYKGVYDRLIQEMDGSSLGKAFRSGGDALFKLADELKKQRDAAAKKAELAKVCDLVGAAMAAISSVYSLKGRSISRGVDNVSVPSEACLKEANVSGGSKSNNSTGTIASTGRMNIVGAPRMPDAPTLVRSNPGKSQSASAVAEGWGSVPVVGKAVKVPKDSIFGGLEPPPLRKSTAKKVAPTADPSPAVPMDILPTVSEMK